MINLSQSATASPLVHEVPADPGRLWTKDATWSVDAPPDNDINPNPDARWPPQAQRTGVCGSVSPRVIALPGGGYRMYYTQILPHKGYPAGANDYDNSSSRILSARSQDGRTWTPESGVRLSPQDGGAGDWRVVSSEVVPALEGGGRLRMYHECCVGPNTAANSIRSAVSGDGGLTWTAEPGSRLEESHRNFAAPRILFLSGGRCRLYCHERGVGVISALSEDGGITFNREPGIRVDHVRGYDSMTAFATEIMQVQGAGYVMYYAGSNASNRMYILRATSDDGLTWRKEPEPVIVPGPGGLDAAKCSEMCVFRVPGSESQKSGYRIVYEACDGTAVNERGVWRIGGATSAA